MRDPSEYPAAEFRSYDADKAYDRDDEAERPAGWMCLDCGAHGAVTPPNQTECPRCKEREKWNR